MKKKILILIKQKFNEIFGLIPTIQKKFLLLTGVLILLLLLRPSLGFSQSDGDYRSAKTGGGWASAGTWEIYYSTYDIWVPTTAWAASTAYTIGTYRSNGTYLYVVTIAGTSAASGGPTGTGTGIVDGTVTWNYVGLAPSLTPSATTNVTILDGVVQTSNGSGYVAGSITIGQGNAAKATATISGGTVTGITVTDGGKLCFLPAVIFEGGCTTIAAATISDVSVAGAYYKNKGTGYNTATVTVGTAWAASTAYSVGNQCSNGGNLYTCATAGTSDVSGGPAGTGTGIADGTVVWNYAGIAATASATVSGGKVTGITVTSAGAGYTSVPAMTITGDGTGASYGTQVSVNAVTVTAGGAGYTTAPKIYLGSVLYVGNTTNARTLTVSVDVTFKNESAIVSGGGTKSVTSILVVGGNLSAESPISFSSTTVTYASSTTVNFNKVGISTISGAGPIAFQNLTVGATTAVINKSTISVLGTTSYNSITSFNFTTPSVTGTVNPTDHTVTLSVPTGTSVTALVPTITLFVEGSISPLSGVAQDFTSPVTYTVTAKDGVTTQPWTVTVTGPSTDATLTALSVTGNTLLPAFNADTLTYSVVLPVGTTIGNLPTVTYTPAANATAVKTDATALPGATTIQVTAQDGLTIKTYTINFSISSGLSDDATLSSLTVSTGTLSPAFAPGDTTYSVVLPTGTTIDSLPAVTYTPAAYATAVKTDATALPGATTIKVTAQDGTTTKTYTINFRVAIPQTISMNTLPDTITYGDADFDLDATASSGLPVSCTSSNLNVATIVSGKIHILNAGLSNITASQAGDSIHSPAPTVQQTLTVNKAMLTVTARDTIRLRGVANPTFKLDYNGFKGTDNLDSVGTKPSVSCSANAYSPLGKYDITLTGGSDNNYNFTCINGKLTVAASVSVKTIASQDIEVYPNPAGSNLYISCTNLLQYQTIGIYSINGKQLLITKIDKNLTGIDMSKFAPGIYIIKITTPDSVVVKQIVKQ